MARSRRQESRGDGSERLFEDVVVQCGLNGCPGVTDGCWWVVRIAVEVSDELLSVVAWSARGFEDEGGQVDARVLDELFPLFSFGHVTWAGALLR